MISEDEKKSLRGPSAKRRFFLFLRHSLLWVLAGVILIWLSSFFIVGSIAEEKIAQLCGGAAYVQSGRLKLSGGVRLKGVVIANDTASLANNPILQADELEINFNFWRLLRGQLQVHSIHLRDIFLAADYNSDSDQWNFQQLPFQRSSQSSGRLPLVTIRNSAVQIRRITSEQTQLITTFGLSGQVASHTGKGEYNFTLQAGGRLGFAGSELQGVFRFAADDLPGLLAMQGRIAMPEAKILDNGWNLENIQFECEFGNRQVALKRCDFSLGEGSVDICGIFEEGDDQQRTMNLDVDIQNLALSDHYQPDAVVYSEPLLELLDPRITGFFTRYHPKGIGDLTFSMSGQLDNLAAADLNGAVVCRDISIVDEKFPYSIDHITGRVELVGRDLYLKELAGCHGDVELAINGAIRNMGPNREMDIQFTSPNMRFDEDLYNALNDSVKKVWFSFSPGGRAGLDYRYQRSAESQRDMKLKLELKGADSVYEHFPYPLENLTGKILYESDQLKFVDLVAHYEDDRRVTLNGQVLELRSGQPNFNIHVDAEQIPVNDLLVNAMPVQQRAIFDRLHIAPDSLADLDVDVFRNETGKRLLDFIAKVNLQSRHLVYDGFALPMEDVRLAADITHESVQLHSFEAVVTDGGKVSMSGRLAPKGLDDTRPGLCLDLDVQQFSLDEAFWQAVGSGADDYLADWRLQDKVNVTGHLAVNLEDASCSDTDLVIRFFDNPLLWSGREMAQMAGQLHLVDEMLFFEQFEMLNIALGSIPVDFLSEKLQTIYTSIRPHGAMDIAIHDGFVRIGPEGLQDIDVRAGVDFKNIALGHEDDIQQLFGQADGHLLANLETGYCQVLAKYDVDHFQWKDYLVTDLQGQCVYDPNTAHFESRQFRANLYDGQVNGDFEIDLSDSQKSDYQLTLSLSEANVQQLLGAEYDQAIENIKGGLASGQLSLEGDLKRLDESQGTVIAHVQNIRLGKQSTMGRVLTAMQLRTPKEFIFNEIQGQALIQGPELIIESARLAGDPLVFRGTGKLNLADKQIEMDLVAFDRFMGQEDTIIDMLARGIGKALWKVEIRGDVEKPEISTVYLSVLKQPLNIFRKKKE